MTVPNFMIVGLQIGKSQEGGGESPPAMPDSVCLGLKANFHSGRNILN